MASAGLSTLCRPHCGCDTPAAVAVAAAGARFAFKTGAKVSFSQGHGIDRASITVKRSATTSSTPVAVSSLPTVSDTKQAFLKAYRRPIPSIYNTVIQELLVQHHLIRYNKTYRYDPILALGFVTVFDQLMDGYPYGDDNAVAIFKAYISALGEDPEVYRADAKELENWVQSLGGAEGVFAFTTGSSKVEIDLQGVAQAAASQSFHYSRFFAVGLFRMLELVSAFDPSTLAKLCAALNIPKTSVERDLDVYRGLLNKLTQAKELQKDFLERERAKQAEREKEKSQA